MAKWPIGPTRDTAMLRLKLNDLWRSGQIGGGGDFDGPAADITQTDINNWNAAFSWGNHADAGYLTSFTETDPVFMASPAAGIGAGDITNWNTAFGWGDHAVVGYLTGVATDETLEGDGTAGDPLTVVGGGGGGDSGFDFHQSEDNTLYWFEATITLFRVSSISPTSGDEAGGEAFTITGTGFRTGDPVTVMFGETEDETATVDNSTTITGTTPAGTGTVNVTVTQGEDSDTLVDGFTYKESAASLDAVVFDQDYLDTPSFSGGQPRAYFIVGRTNRTTGTATQREYLFDGAGSNSTRNLLALRGANTNKPSIWAGTWLAHTKDTDADWHVFACLFDGSNSRIEIDGDRVTGNAGTNSLTEGLRLGSNYLADQDWLDGDEFEVIVTSATPNEETWEKIVGYLAHRAGIQDQLEAGHAYKTTAPEFDPSEISTLLWLKDTNSAGAVSSWQDQSGEDNHAANATSSRQPLAARVVQVDKFGNESGSTKWSYGALASNGNIYATPGSRSRFLKVDPSGETMTEVGSTLSGSGFKFMGAIVAGNGKIYGVPHESSDIPVLDPSDDTTTTFSKSGSGIYYGGALADNGKIYCPPIWQNTPDIQVIDTATDSAATIGSLGTVTAPQGRWSWFVKADNGKLYAPPRDEDGVLVVDPSDDSTYIVTSGVPAGSRKWAGGVKAPNGEIYFIPRNAASILIIDPSDDSVRTIGTFPTDKDKWNGGALINGKIYFTPRNRRSYLIIDPADDSIEEVFLANLAMPTGSDLNLFVGAGVSEVGDLYLTPWNATFTAVIKT